MRVESEQAAKALREQVKTLTGMADTAESAAGQMKKITEANRGHSSSAAALLASLRQIREVTDRNVHGARETRGGTTDLLERAESLLALAAGARSREASRQRCAPSGPWPLGIGCAQTVAVGRRLARARQPGRSGSSPPTSL